MSRTQSSASEAPDGCPKLVLLVGAPGAGKTTIGRALAQRLRVSLVETDEVVAEWAGKPVADVVLDDGEETFRALEAKAVEQVLTGSGVGVLGGGALADEQLRERLRRDARTDPPALAVVWLDVTAPIAASRLGLNVPRPVGLGNVRAQFSTALKERADWYADVATLRIPTDHVPPEQLVTTILTQLEAKP